MSANNELLIQKDTTGKWEIVDRDVESLSGMVVDRTDNLEDAIDIANEYMKEEIVEYGLRIIK